MARPVMVVGRADLGQLPVRTATVARGAPAAAPAPAACPRTRGETAETRPPPQARRPPAAGPRNPTPNVCVCRRIVGTLHRYLSKCERSGRPSRTWSVGPRGRPGNMAVRAVRARAGGDRGGGPPAGGSAPPRLPGARWARRTAGQLLRGSRVTLASAAARALGVAAAGPRGRVQLLGALCRSLGRRRMARRTARGLAGDLGESMGARCGRCGGG